MLVLALNVGSSSVKSAVFDVGGGAERRLFAASVTKRQEPMNASTSLSTNVRGDEPTEAATPQAAIEQLLTRLERERLATRLAAVGHRLVHGGLHYRAPVWLTPAVMLDLQRVIPLAPDHLPIELDAVQQVTTRWPSVRTAASFDTAFHATLPSRARLFGLPRRFTDAGVVRFGFHGLSYEYVVDELRAANALPARVVAAHLGSGASVAAIRDGRSIDTTMGFTPTGGVVMATRSGDLDPGVLLYLARTERLDTNALGRVVNDEGGLRGLSGTTGDMRTLLDRSATDARAAEAVDIFCYQVAKAISALGTALGGIDTLVFTGGIGEHAAVVRARVCEHLSWCGVSLDADLNTTHGAIISAIHSSVTVRIVPTNEELMIARHVRSLLEGGGQHDAN